MTWKRILVFSSIGIVLTMIVVYIVLTIRYHKKAAGNTEFGGFMRPYTCVKTCLTPDEEQDAQKRINKCQEEECEEIKTLLRENDCDKIKSWLNKK